MASNTLGNSFAITSFGESHGKHVGVIIDGCPANLVLDLNQIQYELQRRRPGQSHITTTRNEQDAFEITSGVFEGKSTGSPICILIPNTNQKSSDYDDLKDVYRPSHADFTYQEKYGIRDHAGGGRSSARITAGWVAAGAIAKQLLIQHFSIDIQGYVRQIYTHICPYDNYSHDQIEASIVRCPHEATSSAMIEEINHARESGDSLGGIVRCTIQSAPVGIGDPVFKKLQAQLAHALLSINATKGIQFGGGFDMVIRKGSEVNDEWTIEDGKPHTTSNNSGGIQGGISNGMPIYFDLAFKPTATIGKSQQTIDKEGNNINMEAKGRHDPCVVPRAVPIVEAMTALVLVDLLYPELIAKARE
jgi:chorismate synthase